tara:strand:- start:6480 stop:6932 length:453 start_codon:yes stop_codon:yes gene_type:complete
MSDLRIKTKRFFSKYVDLKTSINIEISLYNASIRFAKDNDIVNSWEDPGFVHIYLQKTTNILSFLENDAFLQKIKDKSFSCKNVGNLEACDIFESWNPKHFKDENVEEGIFQCRKCKSRKTEYYSLQTRSADEPMTNYITCLECKNRWRM